MRNATRLRVGGMLLFLGAASPAFTQVTMLNGDGSLNPPTRQWGLPQSQPLMVQRFPPPMRRTH
jgi:hypothetical protein